VSPVAERLAAERLVVIGNGMAGARTVEEILERGGPDRFAITMFGEEPYGNYNRILLSHVLSGAEDEAGIFLNSPSWYADNGIGAASTRASSRSGRSMTPAGWSIPGRSFGRVLTRVPADAVSYSLGRDRRIAERTGRDGTRETAIGHRRLDPEHGSGL
jgi:hypothetical protein